MAITETEELDVAKKKTQAGKPKRYGTLIRVTDEFADAMRTASSFENVSIAEYATLHLLPIVQKRYRDALIKKAKKMEEEGR